MPCLDNDTVNVLLQAQKYGGQYDPDAVRSIIFRGYIPNTKSGTLELTGFYIQFQEIVKFRDRSLLFRFHNAYCLKARGD